MNKNLKYKKNKIIIKQGFTLIELLTASFIFILIIMITTGFFIYANKLQNQSLFHQKLLDETSYVIEYISRALRMAKKSTDNSCLSEMGLNYEIYNDGKRIRFINGLEKESKDQCQEFYLDSTTTNSTTTNLIKLKYVNTIGTTDFALTSENLNIISLKFNLSDDEDNIKNNTLQPFITILIEVEAKGISMSPKIKIQTSISQRNLDI